MNKKNRILMRNFLKRIFKLCNITWSMHGWCLTTVKWLVHNYTLIFRLFYYKYDNKTSKNLLKTKNIALILSTTMHKVEAYIYESIVAFVLFSNVLIMYHRSLRAVLLFFFSLMYILFFYEIE